MPPFAVGASAQAPCNWPCGPAQVIGVVGNACAMPGGAVDDVAGALDVTGASEVVFFSPHAAISAVAAAVLTPSRANRRRASRRDNSPST
jgi:hypothetical protein